MLSFELSVIDIVLAMAIIVILLLQLKKMPSESTTEPKLSGEERKPLEGLRKSLTKRRTLKTKKPSAHTPKSFEGCAYHFGYLKTLSLGSSVPETCFGCSRMRECMFPNE